MHTAARKVLVYWLEFKNDDEFPGPTFGSIAGGAAFKFGLFRRKDTGQWVTGGSTSEKNISEADAVVLARKHREQLLLGMELLEALPDGADDPEYLNLQKRLELQAPDICRLVWAHKYWALLFRRSDKLRAANGGSATTFCACWIHRLSKPVGSLRWQPVRLAAKFGWPINHLDSALVERNGPPAQVLAARDPPRRRFLHLAGTAGRWPLLPSAGEHLATCLGFGSRQNKNGHIASASTALPE